MSAYLSPPIQINNKGRDYWIPKSILAKIDIFQSIADGDIQPEDKVVHSTDIDYFDELLNLITDPTQIKFIDNIKTTEEIIRFVSLMDKIGCDPTLIKICTDQYMNCFDWETDDNAAEQHADFLFQAITADTDAVIHLIESYIEFEIDKNTFDLILKILVAKLKKYDYSNDRTIKLLAKIIQCGFDAHDVGCTLTLAQNVFYHGVEISRPPRPFNFAHNVRRDTGLNSSKCRDEEQIINTEIKGAYEQILGKKIESVNFHIESPDPNPFDIRYRVVFEDKHVIGITSKPYWNTDGSLILDLTEDLSIHMAQILLGLIKI